MEEVEVLTRDKAAPKNILPTGRVVGVVNEPGTHLYRLKYIDGKQGELPSAYQGSYTGLHYALKDLKKLVSDFWDFSESKVAKNRRTLSINDNAISR